MKKPVITRLSCRLSWLVPMVFLLPLFSFIKSPLGAPVRNIPDTISSPFNTKEIIAVEPMRPFVESKMEVYDSLHLDTTGLSRKVFSLALKGMGKLIKEGKIKSNIISIADFSQPTINKRLYVIDLDNYSLLFQTWVSHGMRSGKEWAQYFSNKLSSHKSSLGFYVTGDTYNGSNGYSLKLMGVEKGINDNAMRRGIVLHGADYVCADLADSQGYIGRSFGCPAVPLAVAGDLIDDVKDGTCLFIYHASVSYLRHSHLLH